MLFGLRRFLGLADAKSIIVDGSDEDAFEILKQAVRTAETYDDWKDIGRLVRLYADRVLGEDHPAFGNPAIKMTAGLRELLLDGACRDEFEAALVLNATAPPPPAETADQP